MDNLQAIRKVVSRDYFLSNLPRDIKIDLRNRIIKKLFEPNLTLDEPIFYHLHDGLWTLTKIMDELADLKLNRNLLERIKRIFYVDQDLSLPNELAKILMGREKIAFFVGAGLSKIMGLPLWDELANLAIDYLERKGQVNHLESLKLKKELNPKQKLSIFDEIVGKEKTDLKQFYANELKCEEAGKLIQDSSNNPYEKLIEIENLIDSEVIKITSNVDILWEATWKKCRAQSVKVKKTSVRIPPDLQIKYDKFSQETKFDNKILYKIHGTITDITSVVATTKRYVKEYRNSDGLQGFLRRIFNECSVIFLGSGIQEFEILEHCLGERKGSRKHFALAGCFTGEEHLFKVKKRYFESLNIQPIPYYRDFSDHSRILEILETWISEIELRRTKSYLNDQTVLDKVLKGETG